LVAEALFLGKLSQVSWLYKSCFLSPQPLPPPPFRGPCLSSSQGSRCGWKCHTATPCFPANHLLHN